MVDLGEIQVPRGLDPVTDRLTGWRSPPPTPSISPSRPRRSGAGNLDIDYFILVPADDRLASSNGWRPARPIGSSTPRTGRTPRSTPPTRSPPPPTPGVRPAGCRCWPRTRPTGLHGVRGRLRADHDADHDHGDRDSTTPGTSRLGRRRRDPARPARGPADHQRGRPAHRRRTPRPVTSAASCRAGSPPLRMSPQPAAAVHPRRVAYYGQVNVYDTRNGNQVWCGRLDDPGRSAGTAGEVWELSAVGGSAHAHDRTLPHIFVDTGTEDWEIATDSVKYMDVVRDPLQRRAGDQDDLPRGHHDDPDRIRGGLVPAAGRHRAADGPPGLRLGRGDDHHRTTRSTWSCRSAPAAAPTTRWTPRRSTPPAAP